MTLLLVGTRQVVGKTCTVAMMMTMITTFRVAGQVVDVMTKTMRVQGTKILKMGTPMQVLTIVVAQIGVTKTVSVKRALVVVVKELTRDTKAWIGRKEATRMAAMMISTRIVVILSSTLKSMVTAR